MKEDVCVKSEPKGKALEKKHMDFCHNTAIEVELTNGYLEMSRINLCLAESAIEADNKALALCEQKLTECE